MTSRRPRAASLIASVVLLLVASISVSGATPFARTVTSADAIEWITDAAFERIEITVAAPDGRTFSFGFSEGEQPRIRVSNLPAIDGQFTFELTLTPRRTSERMHPVNRDGRIRTPEADLVMSGSFSVENGIPVDGTEVERTDTDVAPGPTEGPVAEPEDQVILDDMIVGGSLCVGVDCVNGEAFGFDTIRLKENNLRIFFLDTSNSGSFPTYDWQLIANETANGGLNKFSIEQSNPGPLTPFTIVGGAPDNSFYVNNLGRIGLRTSTPVLDVHLKSGNTPAFRFEQDGTKGFTPRTWDVGGNEVSFFVRDVTANSKRLEINPNGSWTTSTGATLTAGGAWTNASSITVKQDVADLDATRAMQAIRSLRPVTFAYKVDPSEQYVGFIAEEVPDLVATGDRKGLSAMDVVAVLTKVVQEQQKTIDDLSRRLAELEGGTEGTK